MPINLKLSQLPFLLILLITCFSFGENSRTTESIMSVVNRNMISLTYAFNAQKVNEPMLDGKVFVKIEIANNGNVLSCKVDSSTMNSPVFERIVENKIKLWNFGRISDSEGAIEVRIPFTFSNPNTRRAEQEQIQREQEKQQEQQRLDAYRRRLQRFVGKHYYSRENPDEIWECTGTTFATRKIAGTVVGVDSTLLDLVFSKPNKSDIAISPSNINNQFVDTTLYNSEEFINLSLFKKAVSREITLGMNEKLVCLALGDPTGRVSRPEGITLYFQNASNVTLGNNGKVIDWNVTNSPAMNID